LAKRNTKKCWKRSHYVKGSCQRENAKETTYIYCQNFVYYEFYVLKWIFLNKIIKCLTWKVTQYVCKGLELLTRVQFLMNHDESWTQKMGQLSINPFSCFLGANKKNCRFMFLILHLTTHITILVKWIQLWGRVLDTLMVFAANTYWQIPLIWWQDYGGVSLDITLTHLVFT